jgi:hypothetical protein
MLSIAGCPLPSGSRHCSCLIFQHQWSIHWWSWGHFTVLKHWAVDSQWGKAVLQKNRLLRFITSKTWDLRERIFPLNVSVLDGSLVLELADRHVWRKCVILKCEQRITLGCSVVYWKNGILSCIAAETSKLVFWDITWCHLSQFLHRSKFLRYGISGLNLYIIFDVMTSV